VIVINATFGPPFGVFFFSGTPANLSSTFLLTRTWDTSLFFVCDDLDRIYSLSRTPPLPPVMVPPKTDLIIILLPTISCAVWILGIFARCYFLFRSLFQDSHLTESPKYITIYNASYLGGRPRIYFHSPFESHTGPQLPRVWLNGTALLFFSWHWSFNRPLTMQTSLAPHFL